MAHRTKTDGEGKGLDGVIRVDEAEAHLGEMVRQSVEETLNEMLQAEADPPRRGEAVRADDAHGPPGLLGLAVSAKDRPLPK
ncbi:MAG: hypothetical protein NTX40_00095 [Planctomycetota bacterium]|nr:hypothetical protein [Planctomycetota bacterium]